MFVSKSVLACAVLAGLSLASALGPQKKLPKLQAVSSGGLSYASVRPIFAKNCMMCHSGAKPKHHLDLSTFKTMMKGDNEGKVIVPGKPAASRLSSAIHRKGPATAMPPTGPLPSSDVAKIDAWIKAGARP